VNIVILAAGQGSACTRTPRRCCTRWPESRLLGHVIDAARELAPQRICVVYGHGGEAVRDAFAARAAKTVRMA